LIADNMRVLWVSSNTSNQRPSQAKGNKGYNGGGWIPSLQAELTKHPDIALGICSCEEGEPQKSVEGNVTYYTVQNHKKPLKDKFLDLLHYDDVRRDEILWPHYVEQFKRVISDYRPDVIEVFGSELYRGLATMAARELNVPCVLHIQGLLSLSIYIYLPTGVSKWKYYMSDGLKGVFRKFQYLTYWQRSCHREKAILQATTHVIGRTHWDRQAMMILNPQAEYHYGGEILRSCFYEPAERRIPEKTIITTTSSGATYKGFDLVLKMAHILKNECRADFEWRVFGNVAPWFFERLTGIKHQEVNVKLCGVASAEQLRDSILESTLYVQPSYVENSPNSVAEAQMLGVPVVATDVGGTSSMIGQGKSGFLFPATDPYMGVYYIKEMASERLLNKEMGESSRRTALIRHDRKNIVEELINTYEKIRQ